MEPPRGSTYVRTMPSIDPVKSGVCLTFLDIPQVYKWSQDLIALQKRHPYETLQHGLYISRSMTLRINASNEAKKFVNKSIIEGTEINLPNDELFNVLMQIVLRKNEQEWISNFKKLVTFRKLPRNQHGNAPDTTRFDDW
jgi:hypothetical protein